MEDEALWILATVEKHNEKKGFFVVVDDDAGDDKRRYGMVWCGAVLMCINSYRLMSKHLDACIRASFCQHL